eukprot:gnl/MRDRNA2_/MRDRNA2_290815_c0_seq1.p1 gnl/MRDRNA2_/MRDRNA2_290815_c0~~gnl/MRDRNA2_/MRDRNA2_290815_c0_seq1.p1  ORF type:complete len:474 (+),score=62.17 gnl/MRDRNA2_/MRDRNA2_290815_c0_seq1:54-1424(+)
MPLSHVSIPGTHNSACYRPSAFAAAARCQTWDIHKQLGRGIRFFDLRLGPDGALYHGRIECGITLKHVLDTCASFLQEHPGEVVITRIKDERKCPAVVNSYMETLVHAAVYPFYLEGRIPLVREVRGRIMLVRDWNKGLFGLEWGCSSFLIQDEFWQSTGTKKWKVVETRLKSTVPEANALQVHFSSATGLSSARTPLSLARSVNPKLARYLRSTCSLGFVGIIVMDFPSTSLCELIVQRNRLGLDPCRPVSRFSGIKNPGYDIHGLLENLQAELMAAATRADSAASLLAESSTDNGELTMSKEEFRGHISWLGCVLARLVVERAKVEILDPAVEADHHVDASRHMSDPGPRFPNGSAQELQSLKSFIEDTDGSMEAVDDTEHLLSHDGVFADTACPDSPEEEDHEGSLHLAHVSKISSTAIVSKPLPVVKKSLLRKLSVRLGSALVTRCMRQTIR